MYNSANLSDRGESCCKTVEALYGIHTFRICLHQDLSTRGLIFLKRLRQVLRVPEVMSSVTSTMYFCGFPVCRFCRVTSQQSQNLNSNRFQLVKHSKNCLYKKLFYRCSYKAPCRQNWFFKNMLFRLGLNIPTIVHSIYFSVQS